jgi:hypothetical protein
VLAACSSAGPGPAAVLPQPVISVLPAPSSGPYVVVAVDNHFHGIHPHEFNEISARRPFEVKNEGRNLHNFTVVGTGISIDVAPGRQFEWPVLGDVLPPGHYRVVCTYHQAYWNMGGQFDVVP